jgi:hypothetical protein
MTKDEIMTGIHDAECKPELKAHIELVDKALDRHECDYDGSDWKEISNYIALRIQEFDARVIN